MTAAAPGGRRRGLRLRTAGRHRARRRIRLTAVRLAVAAVAGVGGLLALVLPEPAPAAGTPTTGTTTTAAAVPVSVPVGPSGQRAAAPTRVRVPAIDVDSGLVRLGLDEDRVLVPPTEFATAGWFAGGPAPGDTGPAVLAGHVDSTDGPAVFFRLADLTPGDEVLVDRADGSTVRFQVRAVERYPKDAFPTEEVYGPTTGPELRLITCGGEFDRDERSYRDNVVVTAVLVG